VGLLVGVFCCWFVGGLVLLVFGVCGVGGVCVWVGVVVFWVWFGFGCLGGVLVFLVWFGLCGWGGVFGGFVCVLVVGLVFVFGCWLVWWLVVV
jgi:hypothetical protein